MHDIIRIYFFLTFASLWCRELKCVCLFLYRALKYIIKSREGYMYFLHKIANYIGHWMYERQKCNKCNSNIDIFYRWRFFLLQIIAFCSVWRKPINACIKFNLQTESSQCQNWANPFQSERSGSVRFALNSVAIVKRNDWL